MRRHGRIIGGRGDQHMHLPHATNILSIVDTIRLYPIAEFKAGVRDR